MKRSVCSPSTVWFPQHCGNAQLFPELVFPLANHLSMPLWGWGTEHKIWIITISASAVKLNAKLLPQNPWHKTLFNKHKPPWCSWGKSCHHHSDDTKTTEAKGKKEPCYFLYFLYFLYVGNDTAKSLSRAWLWGWKRFYWNEGNSVYC